MYLAEVIGRVVSTKKDEHLTGYKLLVVRPKLVDPEDPSKFRDGANTIVAVDTVGAGEGELVMFCQGSSARQAGDLKPVPVDAAVVAIVDRVDVLGKPTYRNGPS
jgi:ethanolamine utilization protein EutN